MKKHLAGFALASVLVAVPLASAHAEHVFLSVGGGYYGGPGYYRGGYYPGYYGGYYAPYYPAPVYATPYIYAVPAVPSGAVNNSVTGYCPSPAGYYPQVSACYTAWQQVVAPQPALAPIQQPPVAAQPQAQAQPPSQPILNSPTPTHDLDDRQVEAFGAEFSSINQRDETASDHLRDLESRTETFRQSLATRPYSTTDVQEDLAKLQHNMAASPIPVNPPVAMGPTAPVPLSAPQTPVTSVPPPDFYNSGTAGQSPAPTPPAGSNPYQ